MSQAKDQEHFADGLSEELLNLLAQVEELRVIGRTSSFQFKGKNEDLRAIGETLDVAHILEGSVRKSGDKLRITAQLIRAIDGSHLWSQSYDRKLDDVFAMQDEIAAAVVGALKLRLIAGDAPVRATGRPEAYNHYLQGQYHLDRRTRESLDTALVHFQAAVKRDPDDALAWVGLARPTLRRPAVPDRFRSTKAIALRDRRRNEQWRSILSLLTHTLPLARFSRPTTGTGWRATPVTSAPTSLPARIRKS